MSLKIISTELSAPDPFLEIEWRNETENKIGFGESFTIYRYEGDNLENCSLNENMYNEPIFELSPSQSMSHKYRLNVTGAEIKNVDGMIKILGNSVILTPVKL